MFYICAICMVKRSPLITFTESRRELLERVVAPIIDTTPLKDTILLLCGDCTLLIQAMEAFQNTVIIGIRHLLNLHNRVDHDSSKTSVHHDPTNKQLEIKEEIKENTIPEAEVNQQNMMPLPLPIKKEPEESYVKLEEVDTRKPTSQQEAVSEHLLRSHELQLTSEVQLKSEPASEEEAEDEACARDSDSTLTCEEDPYDDEERGLRHDHNYSEASMAVFPHSPRPARGPADPPIPEGWEVRYITEAEAVAELAEARAAPAPAGLPHRCRLCAIAFQERRSYHHHSFLHTKDAGNYICRICQQRMRTEHALRAHTARHLTRYTRRDTPRPAPPYPAPPSPPPPSPPPPRAAPPPPRARRARRRRCTPHAREAAPDGCAGCRGALADWGQFWAHYTSEHAPADAARPRHECYVCRRSYNRQISLYAHLKGHFDTARLKKAGTVRQLRWKAALALRGRRDKLKLKNVRKPDDDSEPIGEVLRNARGETKSEAWK